jgi:hypothetical protein
LLLRYTEWTLQLPRMVDQPESLRPWVLKLCVMVCGFVVVVFKLQSSCLEASAWKCGSGGGFVVDGKGCCLPCIGMVGMMVATAAGSDTLNKIHDVIV